MTKATSHHPKKACPKCGKKGWVRIKPDYKALHTTSGNYCSYCGHKEVKHW